MSRGWKKWVRNRSFQAHSSHGGLRCAFAADAEVFGEVCELKAASGVVASQNENAVTETETYQRNPSRIGFVSKSLDLPEEDGLVTKELIRSTLTY